MLPWRPDSGIGAAADHACGYAAVKGIAIPMGTSPSRPGFNEQQNARAAVEADWQQATICHR